MYGGERKGRKSSMNGCSMSQDAVLAALSDQPLTQKEICQKTQLDTHLVGHRLRSLQKRGLVDVCTLERRYRPFGYVRRAEYAAGSEKMRWPKYESTR